MLKILDIDQPVFYCLENVFSIFINSKILFSLSGGRHVVER